MSSCNFLDRQSRPLDINVLGNLDLTCISLSIRAIAITKRLLGFLQGLCVGEFRVRPIAIFLEESPGWSEFLDLLDDFASEGSFLRRRELFAIGSVFHLADQIPKPLVASTLSDRHAPSVQDIVFAQNDVGHSGSVSVPSTRWHFEQIVVVKFNLIEQANRMT